MMDRWQAEQDPQLTLAAYAAVGHGHSDDFRRQYGLYVELETAGEEMRFVHCRRFALSEVGRTVVVGEHGAVASIEAKLSSPELLGAITCMQFRPAPGSDEPHVAGVREFALPPRPVASTDIPVVGWEHLLYDRLGDPYGYAAAIERSTERPDLRTVLACSYGRALLEAQAVDPDMDIRFGPEAAERGIADDADPLDVLRSALAVLSKRSEP